MDWGLLGLIATVVFGIVAIIAIIVSVRLARKKKPVWAYRTDQIIGLGTDAPPELKLTFNNKPVAAVYRTVLVFFNKGNESIRKLDVTDKVVFRFKGGELLRDPIATSNKIVTRISLIRLPTDDAFRLDFEYLGHNDGAVVEILHTKYEEIECAGNFIDSNEIKNIGDLPSSYPRLRDVLLSAAIPSLAIIFFLVGVISSVFTVTEKDPASKFALPLAIVMSILLIGFMIVRDVLPLLRALRFPKWSVISKVID